MKGCSMKINLALDGLPNFTAIPGSNLQPHHKTTMHICPSIDYVEHAWDDAKYGKPSEFPLIEMTIPTTYDDSIAPPGKHIMGIFLQYAPYDLRNANWKTLKDVYADRVMNLIEDYAPGFKSLVTRAASTLTARPRRNLRPHRRQHFSRRDERGATLLHAACAGMGEISNASAVTLYVRFRDASGWWRDGRAGLQRSARDFARFEIWNWIVEFRTVRGNRPTRPKRRSRNPDGSLPSNNPCATALHQPHILPIAAKISARLRRIHHRFRVILIETNS